MYSQADKISRAANPNYLRKPFVLTLVAELAEVLRAMKEVILPLNACVRTARARIATISSDHAVGRFVFLLFLFRPPLRFSDETKAFDRTRAA